MKQRRCCRRGASTVESAVVLLSMLLLVFGSSNVGLLTLRYFSLAEAARLGTRAAIVRGSGSSLETLGPDTIEFTADAPNSIATACRKMLPTMPPEDVDITVEWPDGNGLGEEVRVEITYPHRLAIPLADFGLEIELNARSCMAIAR